MFGEDLSDANLFRRVRRSDPRAFGVLVRRHDPALRKLAARLLVDDERVDPILQKAYTKAWRSAGVAHLGNVKGAAVLNWLYRLVYNACVDELRHQPSQPAPEPPSGPRVRLPKAPEERRKEALRALAPSERIPLVLVDSEGFSIEAAARILQRPPPRVAADLDRARSHWRDMVIGPPVPVPAEPVPSRGSHGQDDELGPPAPRHAARPDSSDGDGEPAGADSVDGKHKPGSQDKLASQDTPTAEGEDPASGNGAEHATDPAEASEPDQPDRQPSKLKGPSRRKSPEIADPDEVVYAAEGVFDSVRFSNLKQWFKDSRQGTPTK